jgi:threonine dehydratase
MSTYSFPLISMENIPDRRDLVAAAKRIAPWIPKTPVLTSNTLNRETGMRLYFKMESLMPEVGAFKFRGAMNALLSLSAEERKRGVLTMSSGNHAQATARAAKLLGMPATIVMPITSNATKKRNVREMGGVIVDCEPGDEAREQKLEETRKASGATVVHPFNDYSVIAGQATAAKELFDQVENLDAVIAPVGGGGLLSGTALAATYFSPNTRVIGAEPAGADDAYRSMQSGKIEKNETVNTIADGLITKLGDKTFPIIQRQVDRIVVVDDNEIKHAMRMLWERLRAVVEPSGAVSYAAALKDAKRMRAHKVGIIVSGGNVDLDKIPFLQQ